MLNMNNLTYRIGSRLILEEASSTIMQGWKVGVVGANGVGKSTLFKLITKELALDGGEIDIANKTSVGMIRQDLPDGDITLIDVVLAADEERADLLARSETETDPYKIADIHTRLNDIDAYMAPARAASILSGLGFKEEQLTDPMSSLSGGWAMRVALAAAMFSQPDILLLDEPTNHLDLEAIMWLESYLMTYPHTLVIISHDRELLNKCTDHIIHIENLKLNTYTGNYDQFEQERAERRGLQEKMHKKQQAHAAHLQAFINRFKAKASKAKQAQSRVKALEKMDMVGAVIADRSITFKFPQPEEMAPPLLSISQVELGYGDDESVLNDINERIDMDDRIALLGANGNGKSTFMKFIAGRLKPRKGEMTHTSKLRIGYFSQHLTDEMDVNSTPFLEMKALMKGQLESAVRGKLGQFGFGKTLQENKISDLSGGEKARLLFAFISYNAPHMLLLDEPTNHLDIDAREALVQALNAYEGAVIIVSHDPSMVERVADRLWLVKDASVHPYEGDLSAYRKMIIEDRKQEKKAKKPKKEMSKQQLKKQKKEAARAKRKAFPELYAVVEKTERAFSVLNKQKKEYDKQMAEPTFYEDESKVRDVQFSYGKLLQDMEAAEAEWVEAQNKYDAAAG